MMLKGLTIIALTLFATIALPAQQEAQALPCSKAEQGYEWCFTDKQGRVKVVGLLVSELPGKS